MKKIIFLEGLPGVGKTTITNYISNLKNKDNIHTVNEIIVDIDDKTPIEQDLFIENDNLKINKYNKDIIIIDRGPISTLTYNIVRDELVENFMDYGFGTYDAKIKISFNDEKIANSYELNETEFDVQIEIVKKKITVATEKAILIYNGNDQTYEHYTETLKDSRFTFVLTNWKVVNDIDYVGVKNTVTIAIYFGDLDVTDNFEITKEFGTILVYEFAPIFIDRSTYTGSLIEITKEMVHTTDDSYIVSYIEYTCDTSIINAGTYKIHFTRIDFVDALGNPVELKTEAVENNMLIDFTVSKREVTLVAKDIVIEETYHEGMTITIPSDNVKDSSGEFDVVSLGVTVSVPSVTINEYTKWVVFDKNITIIAPSAVRDNFVFIQGSNLIYVIILNNE